jgi:hypothetical protein
MNTTVFKQAPYSSRGNPDTTDETDNIYGTDGGSLLLQPQPDGAGGYTADFSAGVSGGSTSTDSSVDATPSSVKALRTSKGVRKLRVTVTDGEPVTAVVRLTRSERRLLTSKSRTLAAGTHTFTVTIPNHVKAGAATLRLMLTDAAGNTKTAKRTVHVAKRG